MGGENIEILRRLVPSALGVLAALVCLFLVAAASAATFTPPAGKVWHALTGSNPTSYYEDLVGKHAAVRGNFIRWGGN